MRPFRFGLSRTVAEGRSDWVEHVRHAESVGYDVLQVADHLGALDPFVALQLAADVSTTLRLGTYVINNDFYNPLLLARSAATLDLLSEGRLQLGLGAGWNVPEYEAAGLTFDRPGIRIDRLGEAVTVLRRLFGGDTVAMEGDHYTIHTEKLNPVPPQGVGLPIMIGGNGDRLLATAARMADIVAFTGFTSGAGGPHASHFTMAGLADRIEHVRVGAADRFDDLELNLLVQRALVTDDRRAAAEALARDWGGDGLTVDPSELLDSPFLLFGTVDEIVAGLERVREELGVSYVTVFAGRSDGFDAVVERLAGT